MTTVRILAGDKHGRANIAHLVHIERQVATKLGIGNVGHAVRLAFGTWLRTENCTVIGSRLSELGRIKAQTSPAGNARNPYKVGRSSATLLSTSITVAVQGAE